MNRGKIQIKTSHVMLSFLALITTVLSHPVLASPFGAGVYGADVPYGSLTSIGIALEQPNVHLNAIPTPSGSLASGSQDVQVTSLDVIGYQLYLHAPLSTSLSNGIDTIPASAHITPAPLLVNTWGYSTTYPATEFAGVRESAQLIKNAEGPYKNGDTTRIYFGARVNTGISSGTYTTGLTYTAIGKTP